MISVLKLKLKTVTFVLNHVENSAFRLPRSILTSGYPTTLPGATNFGIRFVQLPVGHPVCSEYKHGVLNDSKTGGTSGWSVKVHL